MLIPSVVTVMLVVARGAFFLGGSGGGPGDAGPGGDDRVSTGGGNGFILIAMGVVALTLGCSWLLPDSGITPDFRDEWDRTPLHYAAMVKAHAAAAALVEQGAAVSGQDWYLRTPLHYSAHLGDREMCVLLLEAGADPSVVDATGRRAFELLPEGVAQSDGFDELLGKPSGRLNGWVRWALLATDPAGASGASEPSELPGAVLGYRREVERLVQQEIEQADVRRQQRTNSNTNSHSLRVQEDRATGGASAAGALHGRWGAAASVLDGLDPAGYTPLLASIALLDPEVLRCVVIRGVTRTHPRTHARTHSRTHPRTHSRTHSRTHPLTHSRSLAHTRTRPPAHTPTRSWHAQAWVR